MRVLLTHRPGGAYGYISDGWFNCLRDKGHEVRRWDATNESWVRFSPDLYIGCSGHKQPIPRDRNCKIAIHVNPYGPVHIAGIDEAADTIRWTLNQKPDAVFGYGQEEDRMLWSYWTERHGIQWVPMPTAGDRTIFKQTVDQRERLHDIVYLGGYWPYKGKTIDAFLLPVLKDKQLVSRTYGWGDWPSGVCAGTLPEDQACQFLNAGRIGPCISEAHTQSHGIDIPERAFKLALCGTLVVHDAIPTLRGLVPSAVICPDPEYMLTVCKHFAADEDDRIRVAAQQQTEVLAAHTYHHRIATLLRALGFATEAEGMIA